MFLMSSLTFMSNYDSRTFNGFYVSRFILNHYEISGSEFQKSKFYVFFKVKGSWHSHLSSESQEKNKQ